MRALMDTYARARNRARVRTHGARAAPTRARRAEFGVITGVPCPPRGSRGLSRSLAVLQAALAPPDLGEARARGLEHGIDFAHGLQRQPLLKRRRERRLGVRARAVG